MQEAIAEGILSMNHRSEPCMRLVARTIQLCRQKLDIPADYTLFFASSATECWEIIAQSCLRRQAKVLHAYQGAFGEKWASYTQKLSQYAHKDLELTAQTFEKIPDLAGKAEVVCLTPSETSNGTALAYPILEKLLPTHALSALDVTSCLGGVRLPISKGDIWFASVQKCLGLPAGLAIGILSPRAVALAYEIGERSHYNSLTNILDNIQKFQTPYTPNVLGIYLLNKVMQQVPHIDTIDAQTHERAKDWYSFFENIPDCKPLACPDTRSSTVLCLESTPEKISALKQRALENNLIFGNGYDKWKENTYRIANFPALTSEEITAGKVFLEDYFCNNHTDFASNSVCKKI